MSGRAHTRPEGPGEPTSRAWPLRILIHAPLRSDARLTVEFLSKAGLEAEICRDVSEVCDSIEEGSAALILAEEALNSKSIPAIIETLERQSSWSNLPITIVTSGGEATQSRLRSLGAFGHARNVTILERPFRPSTLISTVEVALNARRRQYQVRDLLFNLQASEDHLKGILESISDGFAALDSGWKFTYVNTSFAKLISPLYSSADAVLNRNIWELFPDMVGSDIEQRFRKAMEEQKMEAFETFYEALNGWFDIRAYPSVESLSIYLREISEQKKAEEFSAMHVRRAEMISSIAGDLLLTNSPRTLLPAIFARVATSVKAQLYFNYLVSEDRSKLILESSDGMTSSERADFSELAFGQALCSVSAERQTPLIINVRDCNLEAAAQLHQLGVRAYACHPLQVGDRLIGTISFGSKLRDSFDLEELRFMATISDLVASSIDRSRLINEVNAARDNAERANHAKDHFLATISHELRTPLSPVLLVAEAAASNPSLPEHVRSDFALIRRNVAVEARLVDDLLDLARVNQGRMEIQRNTCDIHSILREAVTNVKSEMQQKRISLSLDVQAKQHYVLGDSVRLQQIFWNVLKNAVRFTPEGGQIGVTTNVRTDRPDTISIRFTDTGIGMSAAELSDIFKPFAQGTRGASESTRSYKGLGLGLFIARMLTEAHSGQIRAESPGLGRGTSFIIELPLLSVPLQKDESLRRKAAQYSGASGESAPHRHRILLVEDHEDTCLALASLLRLKYEVVTATNASEARSHAQRESFDLVISDIGLPDETGYELMAGLHNDHGLKGIALTGYGMEEDITRSHKAGFIAHLTKPAGLESLEEILAEVFAAL